MGVVEKTKIELEAKQRKNKALISRLENKSFLTEKERDKIKILETANAELEDLLNELKKYIK